MNIDSHQSLAPENPEDSTRTSRDLTTLPGTAAALTGRSIPAIIGGYRILQLLGEGGMGTVYEAEQQQPHRTVALKVIKPGLASLPVLRRFENESQALGRLQHPGIAQIYEAGTADTGFGPQPYFAMEFIRGESLQRYAESHRLNVRQRLELMVKVCEAVHHAHQRGIIHRDLKPGNILVDETGQPKVLDFGLARMTDSDAQATRQTDMGQLVGTLAYMSPEQVLADPLELDTRSDVYALGVILYELLAGRLPYNLSRKLHEAVQTIREEDPAPLSSLNRNYRGDVETIASKALEKEPARRYSSAAELAGDIQRYLQDEPITARPPTASYQLQKFARRHRALVGGAGAVFVVLVAGIAGSTWQAVRAGRARQVALQERDRATSAEQAAARERDRAVVAEQAATSERNQAVIEKQRADTEAATATAINDFLQNDLLAEASASSQAQSGTKPDPDLKVRTALDRAAAHIAGKFDKQPLVEASIRETIGKTYRDLGLYPEAQRQVERALDLRRRALGGEHHDTLASMNDLAALFWYQGKYSQAEASYGYVLGARRRVLGGEHRETLATMFDLASTYAMEGKRAEAEALNVKILEVQGRVFGEEHPDTLKTMNNLAAVYQSEGKYAGAAALLTKVLEVRRQVLGEEHPDTLATTINLASVYQSEGKYADSAVLLTKVLEFQKRVLGEEHPDTLTAMNNLGGLYRLQRKYVEAEKILTRALEMRQRILGGEHPSTLNTMAQLGRLDEDQGKYAQAEALLTKVLEIRGRVLGENHPNTLGAMVNLAKVYYDQDKYAEAEPVLRRSLAGFEKIASSSWVRFDSQSLLGASLAGQKKYAEAEPLLMSGYQGMIERETTIPADSRSALDDAGEWIVRLYQNWGKPEKAAEWQNKVQATKHLFSATNP